MRHDSRVLRNGRTRFRREAIIRDSQRGQRCLLRPLRRRAERRPLPDVSAAARRSAAVLQRAARLLRAEPVRRRRPRDRRLPDLQLGQGRDPRNHQGEYRHPARDVLIFEDPPIHDIHRKLLSRMFTPRKINAAGAQDPRILRSQFGSADRHRRLRLRRRPRRADADAGDRHAAGRSRKKIKKPHAISRTRRCAPRPASRWRPRSRT